MSDSEDCDNIDITSDKELEGNDLEISSDDGSDFDQEEDELDLDNLSSKSIHQWQRMSMNQSVRSRRQSTNVLSRKSGSKVKDIDTKLDLFHHFSTIKMTIFFSH